jgi:hypothetical protein
LIIRTFSGFCNFTLLSPCAQNKNEARQQATNELDHESVIDEFGRKNHRSKSFCEIEYTVGGLILL